MSTRLGKYQLIKQIAKGGMAEVFLAKQVGPAGFEQEVVIKRILPDNAKDPHFVEMFLSEASVVAAISHPNIVHIIELGEHEGTYFIAMEAVRGVSVSQLIKRLSALNLTVPEPFAARIVSEACAGLGYAHNYFAGPNKRGVLHGDVSPDNILVAYNGAVKIIDFGLARARDDVRPSDKKSVHGKMRYMAPERTQGLPVDGRSDLFSLSIVLYEALTGAHPFGNETGLAAAAANARNDPTPARELLPTLTTSLERILELGLARDVSERYESAELMRRDLESFLRGSAAHVGDAELGEFVSSVVRGGEDDLVWLKSWGGSSAEGASRVREAGKLGGVGVASGHLAPRSVRRPHSVSAIAKQQAPKRFARPALYALVGVVLAVLSWIALRAISGESHPVVAPVESQRMELEQPTDIAHLKEDVKSQLEGEAGVDSRSSGGLQPPMSVTPPAAPTAAAPPVDVIESAGAADEERDLKRQSPPLQRVAVSPPLGPSMRGTGRLEVTSNAAGARVQVDGRDVGEAPVSLALLEGEHVVTVVSAGVERQKRLSTKNGASEALHVDFQWGYLSVEGVPMGVVCSLNGAVLPRERWSKGALRLPVGRHRISCDDPAGQVQEKSFELNAEQRYSFSWPN